MATVVKSNEGVQFDPFRTITGVQWAVGGWLVITVNVQRVDPFDSHKTFDVIRGAVTVERWEYNDTPKRMPYSYIIEPNDIPDGLEKTDKLLRGEVHEFSSEEDRKSLVFSRGKTSVQIRFPGNEDSDSDPSHASDVAYFIWVTSRNKGPEFGTWIPVVPRPMNIDEALGPFPEEYIDLLGPHAPPASWIELWNPAQPSLFNFAHYGITPPLPPDRGLFYSTSALAENFANKVNEFFEASDADVGEGAAGHGFYEAFAMDITSGFNDSAAMAHLTATITARRYKQRNNFPYTGDNDLDGVPDPTDPADMQELTITHDANDPTRIVTVAFNTEGVLSVS